MPEINDAVQVNSRTRLIKRVGVEKVDFIFAKGKILLEKLLERYEEFHAETAWLPEDDEGYIVWLGRDQIPGIVCKNLQDAMASAILKNGGKVRSKKGESFDPSPVS